jgi:hypothetical protein
MLKSLIIACAVFSLLSLAPSQGTSQGNPSAFTIEDSIRAYDREINSLQHALEGATIDWERLRHSGIRSWIVGDPSLRDSLFYALLAADSSLQSEAGAEALVLATPTDDLIEVRFGNAVFKGMTLQNAIKRSGNRTLYHDVVNSYRYSRDIEVRDPAYALETEYEPQLLNNDRLLTAFSPLNLSSYKEGTTFRADLSLSGIQFRAGQHWGGEFKLGNEEINFPFWTSGRMAFMASYDGVKLGFVLPFEGGLHESDAFPPFVIRSRRLTGARGIVGSADFGLFGGTFSVARLTKNDVSAVPDPAAFYHISTFAQAYFSFGVGLTHTTSVRVKVGGGLHQVKESTLGMTPDGGNQINEVATNDFYSPYLKFEFLSETAGRDVRVSVQFYDISLMNSLYLEVVDNLLGLELMYMWPLAADRPEWQNPEFLILTPHIYVSF